MIVRLGEALEVDYEAGRHGPEGHGLGRAHVLLAEGRVPEERINNNNNNNYYY